MMTWTPLKLAALEQILHGLRVFEGREPLTIVESIRDFMLRGSGDDVTPAPLIEVQ